MSFKGSIKRRKLELPAFIELFLTQRDLVRLIASKIKSTRRLFSFMLHFSPALRCAYTTEKRWNDVFDLRRRIQETWGRAYVTRQNLLGIFVAWARHPASCLGGCGGKKRAHEHVCQWCARHRVKHTSDQLAKMWFTMWRGPASVYYYMCDPALPKRTLEEDLNNPEMSGMVYEGDVITSKEAKEYCEQHNMDFNYDKHMLVAYDYMGRCVRLTTYGVLISSTD